MRIYKRAVVMGRRTLADALVQVAAWGLGRAVVPVRTMTDGQSRVTLISITS